MYSYRTKRKGEYFDYSLNYSCKSLALKWYNEKGVVLEKVSNRKLVLFKNSLKYGNNTITDK